MPRYPDCGGPVSGGSVVGALEWVVVAVPEPLDAVVRGRGEPLVEEVVAVGAAEQLAASTARSSSVETWDLGTARRLADGDTAAKLRAECDRSRIASLPVVGDASSQMRGPVLMVVSQQDGRLQQCQ